MPDPNGTPPPAPQVNLPPDFFVCYLLADLAVHMLTGMASQAKYVGRAEEAKVFEQLAAHAQKFRDEVRQQGASAIVIVGANDLPKS